MIDQESPSKEQKILINMSRISSSSKFINKLLSAGNNSSKDTDSSSGSSDGSNEKSLFFIHQKKIGLDGTNLNINVFK